MKLSYTTSAIFAAIAKSTAINKAYEDPDFAELYNSVSASIPGEGVEAPSHDAGAIDPFAYYNSHYRPQQNHYSSHSHYQDDSDDDHHGHHHDSHDDYDHHSDSESSSHSSHTPSSRSSHSTLSSDHFEDKIYPAELTYVGEVPSADFMG